MRLLRFSEWLLGCCYAAARVPRAVVRAVSRVPRVVARAVARVPGWCHDAVALNILLSSRD